MTRVFVPLLAVVSLVGCGTAKPKPPPKTLSHGRFVFLANHACAVAVRKAKRFKTPTNLQMFDRVAAATQRVYDRMLFVLQGLAPPPSEAAAYRRLLDAANAQESAFAHLIDEADAHHAVTARTLARRLDKLGKKFNRRAKRLGLTVCAKP